MPGGAHGEGLQLERKNQPASQRGYFRTALTVGEHSRRGCIGRPMARLFRSVLLVCFDNVPKGPGQPLFFGAIGAPFRGATFHSLSFPAFRCAPCWAIVGRSLRERGRLEARRFSRRFMSDASRSISLKARTPGATPIFALVQKRRFSSALTGSGNPAVFRLHPRFLSSNSTTRCISACGAGFPVQISNCRAPCCTNISIPVTTGMPRPTASLISGVSRGL